MSPLCCVCDLYACVINTIVHAVNIPPSGLLVLVLVLLLLTSRSSVWSTTVHR